MIFCVCFRGPAMEARDVRAGESPTDSWEEEIEAGSESEAREKGEKLAEEQGEGAVVVDVQPTFDP